MFSCKQAGHKFSSGLCCFRPVSLVLMQNLFKMLSNCWNYFFNLCIMGRYVFKFPEMWGFSSYLFDVDFQKSVRGWRTFPPAVLRLALSCLSRLRNARSNSRTWGLCTPSVCSLLTGRFRLSTNSPTSLAVEPTVSETC